MAIWDPFHRQIGSMQLCANKLSIMCFRLFYLTSLVSVCILPERSGKKKSYESQIWSLCIAKRRNVVTSCHHDIVTSDTSGLYDYPLMCCIIIPANRSQILVQFLGYHFINCKHILRSTDILLKRVVMYLEKTHFVKSFEKDFIYSLLLKW